MRPHAKWLFLLTISLGLSGLTHGQISGKISGRITDRQTGLPIPGANVLITGTVTGANSNADGRYLIGALAPGSYTIRISAVGYARFEREGVRIASGETTALNAALQPMLIETGEVVITASKRRQNLDDAPTSIGIMNSRELAQKDNIYLDEVLEHAPGVHFIGSQINIRGSSGFNYGAGSRVLLLIDGVPVMPGDSGDIKWSVIPATQIEQVEIVKGAGSALYGSSALGGVVNLITKSASSTPQTNIRLSAGMYDKPMYGEWRWTDRLLHFDDIDIDHTRRIGHSDIMVALGRHQSTGYAQNGYYQRVNSSLKWQRKVTPRANLTLSSFYEASHNGSGLMWRSQRYALEVPKESLGDKVRSDKFGLNLFHRWAASERFALNTRLSWFRNYWKNYYHDNLNGSQANRIGLEVQGDYQFSNLNALTIGAEESWDIVDSDLVGEHDQYVLSFYAQNERKLTSALALTLGIRYDFQRVDTGFEDNNWSPKLGLVWHIQPWLSMRASSGRGFRAASMSERFSDSVYSGLRLQPNPNLKSETAWSHEAGFNLRLPPLFGFELNGFFSDYWDLIEPIPDANQNIKFINVTRARISGGEAKLICHPGIRGLILQSAYTYMDPRDLDLDEVLAYRPRHLVQSTISYGPGPIEVSADYRYISRLETVKLYPNDDRVAQKTLDMHVTWKYANWSLGAHVNNVLNHNHTQMERTLMPIRHYAMTLRGAF